MKIRQAKKILKIHATWMSVSRWSWSPYNKRQVDTACLVVQRHKRRKPKVTSLQGLNSILNAYACYRGGLSERIYTQWQTI